MSHAIIAVPFHAQTLTAVLVDNVPHVAMKTICENIGIDWEGQRQKISRHPVLNQVACMIKATATDGKMYEMLMMPIKYLNGWLFGVDSSRVKPEARDRVIEYQRECFEVLANHFMPKAQPEQPKPKHITSKEKLQLRLAIEQHCAKSGDSHRAIWTKLNKAYHVNTIELLPTGKVPEMLTYLGLRVPELDEMVLVPQRQLLALENKAKAIPAPIQGELVNNAQPSSATLTINHSHDGVFKRTLITEMGDGLSTVWVLPKNVLVHTVAEFQQIVEMGFILIDKNRLDEITLKQLGALIA